MGKHFTCREFELLRFALVTENILRTLLNIPLGILILQVFSLHIQFYDQCQILGLQYHAFKILRMNICGDEITDP